MRQDGGGQAMLAQRRAQRRADEEAMAEAVRTRPAGDDTPLRPPGVADHLLAAPSTVGLRQTE